MENYMHYHQFYDCGYNYELYNLEWKLTVQQYCAVKYCPVYELIATDNRVDLLSSTMLQWFTFVFGKGQCQVIFLSRLICNISFQHGVELDL